MKEKFRILATLSCMALCHVGASKLRADSFSISGSAWENGTTVNVPPAGSSVYGTTPTATFTVTGSSPGSLINFNAAPPGSYTLGGFLNHTTVTPGNTVSFLTGSSHSGDNLNNTLFQFLGSTTLANDTVYTFEHDDGFVFYLNGTAVVNTPGPSAPAPTSFCVGSASFCSGFTFTTLPGTYDFTLDYAEVLDGAAVLMTDLPLTGPATAVTPEPSSLLLLGSGLAVAAAMLRRRLFV